MKKDEIISELFVFLTGSINELSDYAYESWNGWPEKYNFQRALDELNTVKALFEAIEIVNASDTDKRE